MGFMQKAENLKYVGVRYGMLSYKTDANDTHPNVVKRSVTDDNGNVTGANHYVEFTGFEGYVTRMAVKEVEFNNKMLKFFEIDLEDGDDRIRLQLKWAHPMCRYTLAKIPNIDFSQKLEIIAGKDKRDYNTMYVRQNGQLVDMYYTRETPHDKPSWEPLKNKKGEIVQWDMSAEDEYYEKMIQEYNGKLPSVPTQIENTIEMKPEVKAEPAKAPVIEAEFDDFGDDDLPF